MSPILITMAFVIRNASKHVSKLEMWFFCFCITEHDTVFNEGLLNGTGNGEKKRSHKCVWLELSKLVCLDKGRQKRAQCVKTIEGVVGWGFSSLVHSGVTPSQLCIMNLHYFHSIPWSFWKGKAVLTIHSWLGPWELPVHEHGKCPVWVSEREDHRRPQKAWVLIRPSWPCFLGYLSEPGLAGKCIWPVL